MVCAPNQVTLATRPENMPAIRQLFRPWSYFIDTTYAVGPRNAPTPSIHSTATATSLGRSV